MPRAHPVGVRRETVPIPAVEENTTYVPAGALKIGVEFRVLNDAIVQQHFSYDERALQIVNNARKEVGNDHEPLDDSGVSFHVCDAETGDEHLRFDAFSNDPHYHYISPGRYHVVVAFDEAANGNCTQWVLNVLESQLGDMLRFAEADELADRVDEGALDRAMNQVRKLLEDQLLIPSAR
ncbi:MAG: hypothetical protein WAM97_01220 [Acidimicrobiales bacterium]